MRVLLLALLVAAAAAKTRLVLLGTGTPNLSVKYAPAASAVLVDGTPYLVDAGEGAIRRFFVAGQELGLAAEGLDVMALDTMFVTHLHSDHVSGVNGAILLPWALGRATNMTVFGPAGTQRMVREMVDAERDDVRVRRLTFPNGGYSPVAFDVQPDSVVFEDERVRVTAFEVEHGPPGVWQSFGYRFDVPADGVSIVFSGDTRPVPAVADNCAGCDVLVHEVFSDADYRALPNWQKEYYLQYHSSAASVAEVATAAKPAALVLNHHIMHEATPEVILDEVERRYDGGDVHFGYDFDVFEVEPGEVRLVSSTSLGVVSTAAAAAAVDSVDAAGSEYDDDVVGLAVVAAGVALAVGLGRR